MPKPLIWIFGNAVQDVTVTVDIDMLLRENSDLIDSLRLTETPIVKKGLLVKTQVGTSGFGVELNLEDPTFAPAHEGKNLYSLSPGEKYTLSGRVESLDDRPDWRRDAKGVTVHCDDISWGGGGINVCRFIRALAPNPRRPRLRYTDYGMSRTLDRLVGNFESLLRRLPRHTRGEITWDGLVKEITRLMQSDMRLSEMITSHLSDTFARYSSETTLEVFLASIFVESLLFRTKTPVFRRNWVFSRFHAAGRSTHDKIVCRSKAPSEAQLGARPEALRQFLQGEHQEVGAIMLNSLKDELLFKSAYKLCRSIYERRLREHRQDFIGVLAMTMAMQKFVPWMLKYGTTADKVLPSFIWVFNEEEAVSFARALGGTVGPLIRAPGDLPNILNFANFVRVVRARFAHPSPRIYVTIGPHGSLGYDGESNNVLHVSYFSRQGDLLYDTNACGDAYCAAITLLEWAKRNFQSEIGPDGPSKEMLYFMAVATAAAYCKARDRRGRIDVNTVADLLQDAYLGSAEVGVLDTIAPGKKLPDWIDQDGRARRPPVANFHGVRQALLELLRPQSDRE